MLSIKQGGIMYHFLVFGLIRAGPLMNTLLIRPMAPPHIYIKKRSRRYPAKTITHADYADDIAILANTPNQAETLLHGLERAAAGIGPHVNAHKPNI